VKKVAFITPPDAGYGFSLAGVPQYVGKVEDAEDMLKKAVAQPDNGLVIIDERMIKVIAEEDLRELERGWHGILLVLPSPEKPPPEVEDYAMRLIRRAIGYHMRLKL
jgi:V/A-type H+-transporting ATPase subunit F